MEINMEEKRIEENHMEWVDINLVIPNSYNPKDTDSNNDRYQSIVAGIKEMGMNSPVDVREIAGGYYEIIDGFHRWKACKEECGYTRIPISSWGKISDDQAKKITILKEKARVPLDLIKTSHILNQLAQDTSLDKLALQLGYKLPELQEDIKLVSFNWKDYDKTKNGGSGDGGVENTPNEIRTLSIVTTLEQYQVIQQAIEKAKKAGETDSESRALELICGDYLAGK